MRVLQVHNFYQRPGGEDQVYAAEFELLTRNGHEVRQYSVHNDAVRNLPAWKAAYRTIWNAETYAATNETVRKFRPEIIHCHNTFPLVSPAIYYAAAKAEVPLVQTLHNYRLICPAATLYRQGRVCEDCLRHAVPYDGVIHKCYRGDRGASAAVASMLTLHRLAGTWTGKVTKYIALTEFARGKLVQGGLLPEKIAVKPNFLAEDPGPGSGEGGFALFVGRLSAEKGLTTLLRAWAQLPDLPLRIIGDGPLRSFVQGEAQKLPNVTLMGFRERPQVVESMRSAACLIIPSEWYEGFPMTLLEAMACGTPIVASDLGSLRELVPEGVVGTRFIAGDSNHLAQKVRSWISREDRNSSLRSRVRSAYEETYTAAKNYEQLMKIYERAMLDGAKSSTR